MEPYIYSVNKNTHIIDLEKTEECLKKACEFLFEQAKLGKSIVFVGTKRQTKDIIENEAKRCGAKYVNDSDLIGYDTDGVLFGTNWIRDLADEHLPLHCERYLLVDREKRNV